MTAFLTLSTVPTDDAFEIQAIVKKQLIATGYHGVLPTPLHEVMDALSVRKFDLEEFANRYVANLYTKETATVRSALRKVRGIADLDNRSVHLPPLKSNGQNAWRDGHELTHILLPWHRLGDGRIYSDTYQSLSETVQDRIEQEANLGAKNFIFQSEFFIPEVNDSDLDFDRIIKLAAKYGASIKATFWAAVQAKTGHCVGVTYLPKGNLLDDLQRPILHKPFVAASPGFAIQYPNWCPLPEPLPEWKIACSEGEPRNGEANVIHDGQELPFHFSSFWNSYELMVLLKPKQKTFRVFVPQPVHERSVVSRNYQWVFARCRSRVPRSTG